MTDPADTRELRDFASEFKFLVDPAAAAGIRDWARARLDPDPYGLGPSGDEYQTTTLYFDTTDFDVFHRRASYGRSKYRIRRYHDETTVFLERKLRRAALLSKRRTLLPIASLPTLTAAAPINGTAWFVERLALRRLRPACQITYDRVARIAQHDSGRIRLTLDENIRAVAVDALAFAAERGRAVAPDHLVLELKFHQAMPALFKQLVEEFKLVPCRLSKYRLAAREIGLARDDEGDGTADRSGDVTYA